MSRIAFVQHASMEYLGTMCLGAVLQQAGHQVEVFISRNPQRLVAAVKCFGPDITAFSCMTGMHTLSLETARLLKKTMRTLTLFGGPHPTFFPELIEEEGVDALCRGEGEGALLDLAAMQEAGRDVRFIPNLWVKTPEGIVRNEVRPLIEDLDTLPYPARTVYYRRYPFLNYSRKAFIAGRGCPYQCTYCFNESLAKLYQGKGRYVRLRSVAKVIDEITYVLRTYGGRTVYMMDDTFILNRQWLREFLSHYRSAIRLPFLCLVRADLLDEEIVSDLAASGCYCVFFGVESGDEELRNIILGKRISDAQIIQAARLLKKFKIRFRTYNMLGIPGEDTAKAFATVQLNQRIGTDYPWCSLLQPYPRTALSDYVRDKGLQTAGAPSTFFFSRSILALPQIKELANLQKLFFVAVKFPSSRWLVSRLIRLPANIVFTCLFLIGYAWSYWRSERLKLREVAGIGLRNIGSFLAS